MLSVLAWIVLIVLFFRILFRYIFPYVLAYYLKKLKGSASQNFANRQSKNFNKEGNISIKHIPENKDVIKDGEYVDFEDVKDLKDK